MSQVLIQNTYALLQDEIINLLHAMTVQADLPKFFGEMLPSILVKVEGISDEHRNYLMSAWPQEADPSTFTTSLKAFLSDLRYFQTLTANYG